MSLINKNAYYEPHLNDQGKIQQLEDSELAMVPDIHQGWVDFGVPLKQVFCFKLRKKIKDLFWPMIVDVSPISCGCVSLFCEIKDSIFENRNVLQMLFMSSLLGNREIGEIRYKLPS